jgi:DNA processing protein
MIGRCPGGSCDHLWRAQESPIIEQMFAPSLLPWQLTSMTDLSESDLLRLAFVALEVHRTPARISRALEFGGPTGLMQAREELDRERQDRVDAQAEDLSSQGIRALIRGLDGYPTRLDAAPQAPPLLFCVGNPRVLSGDGIGMCGARNASAAGLEAARTCGEEVAALGMNVISGYARGVDTETHLGALGAGGRTIIVLAEGITRFRQKKVFGDSDFDPNQVVVVSQFAPGQVWTVGNAMTRNTVIAGLARALVVVEAGETGGTLNAGLRALQMKRPVLALNFTTGTPLGNQVLFDQGARAVSSRRELRTALQALAEDSGTPQCQLHLL